MKLTIWTISQRNDSDVYSILAKTKKQALAQYWWDNPADYSPILEKRVIEFKDSFDLFDHATTEGGGRTGTGRLESVYLIKPNGAQKMPIDWYDYAIQDNQIKINSNHSFA